MNGKVGQDPGRSEAAIRSGAKAKPRSLNVDSPIQVLITLIQIHLAFAFDPNF